jgi:uncharacterized membrane protein YuzA (DUF378 family)
MRYDALDWTAIVLTIIGALNWGLIGLFRFNLVSFLFGEMTLLSRVVYTLVGIAGIYLIYTASKSPDRDVTRE